MRILSDSLRLEGRQKASGRYIGEKMKNITQPLLAIAALVVSLQAHAYTFRVHSALKQPATIKINISGKWQEHKFNPGDIHEFKGPGKLCLAWFTIDGQKARSMVTNESVSANDTLPSLSVGLIPVGSGDVQAWHRCSSRDWFIAQDYDGKYLAIMPKGGI